MALRINLITSQQLKIQKNYINYLILETICSHFLVQFRKTTTTLVLILIIKIIILPCQLRHLIKNYIFCWILQHLNDPCETCETFFLLLIRQSCSGLSSLHHWDGSERLSRKISYQVVLEVLWVLVHPHLEIPYHPSLLVVLETHNRNKYCLNFYILCHSIQIHCNMEKVRKFDLSCTFLTFYLFFAVRLNQCSFASFAVQNNFVFILYWAVWQPLSSHWFKQ